MSGETRSHTRAWYPSSHATSAAVSSDGSRQVVEIGTCVSCSKP